MLKKSIVKTNENKKVIKLISLFATIKPMISLATYPFQVTTNYFSIIKNQVM